MPHPSFSFTCFCAAPRDCVSLWKFFFAPRLFLLLINYPRPAHPFPFRVNRHLDAVSDLDERNSTGHPVLLAVEGHRSRDRRSASPLALNRKHQLFLPGHSANCEIALELHRLRARLHHFRRMKANQRTLLRRKLSLSAFRPLRRFRLGSGYPESPTSSSGDLNFTLALHFSKVPAISIEAFRLNLIELSHSGDPSKSSRINTYRSAWA
jgi:hypothetical protein